MLETDQAKRIRGRKRKEESKNLLLPPTVEYADLIDKLMVRGDFLPEEFEFKTELEKLGQFSNAVAHVRPLVRSNAYLDMFVCRLEAVILWITAIERKIASFGG
ncbi:MAG: hypothetical protein ABSG62_19445 [Terracidiphilus sp.]